MAKWKQTDSVEYTPFINAQKQKVNFVCEWNEREEKLMETSNCSEILIHRQRFVNKVVVFVAPAMRNCLKTP